MTKTVRRTSRNPPAKAPQRNLIDQAVRLADKSRNNVTLEAACEHEQPVCLEQTTFTLDTDRFKRVQALLDAPVAQRAALRKLLSRKAAWEA